ncbi:MAG: 6,7-dimethyl-8-ribityllumazine synthase [Alphaproteobacteria bacterium]|nr:6,7-dimethyl-8-ribityllumazine synthase [Alphaproteobacteria bacterium]
MDAVRIKLIVADFYQDIARDLVTGAKAAVQNYQATNPSLTIAGVDTATVPGALEIPAAIRFAIEEAKKTRQDYGYVALGCVIRGETSHYDIVAHESAHGLQILALNHFVAIGNGILTVETMEQAKIRANPHKISDTGKGAVGDKGGFAALACLRMLELKRQAGLL